MSFTLDICSTNKLGKDRTEQILVSRIFICTHSANGVEFSQLTVQVPRHILGLNLLVLGGGLGWE